MAEAHGIAGLHAANEHLRALLARVQQQNQDNPAPLDEISDILSDLAHAMHVLHALPAAVLQNDKLALELASYRETLTQLEVALPVVRGRLFAERARLDAENAHRTGAAAWTQARKTIL